MGRDPWERKTKGINDKRIKKKVNSTYPMMVGAAPVKKYRKNILVNYTAIDNDPVS